MQYMTVKQTAEKWGISERRVRTLCDNGRVDGAVKVRRSYQIPINALKPIDARATRYLKIPEKYKTIFNEIDALKLELNKKRPLTQSELKRIYHEFLIDYTYHSNAIEGNTLTLQETALVLEGITVDTKPIKEHLEAVGHRDAFTYVQELVKANVPFTEKIIKEIHSLVLMDRPEDKGVYRQIPVRIMGAEHTPPEPHFIQELMNELVKEFQHSKLHPIEVATLFHLKFENIHPFIDGNGRTGRLILNLFLMQSGYHPINIKFADRKLYYDAFKNYNKNNLSDDMVFIITKYLKERFEQIISYL